MRAFVLSARRRLPAAAGLAAVVLALVFGLLATTGDGVAFVVETQRELHRSLAAALAVVREQGPAAAGPLVALAFVYGVFHAAGPGHGKVVMTTYLTTHEARLARGLALTAAAALAQALTAVVAVHTLVVVLGQGLRASRGGVAQLDAVSFALVALLGLYLALRAGFRLTHGHHHVGGHACAACSAHGARAPAGPWSALGVVAAIGARPCAGAVVVLLLAYAADLRLVGVAATVAMALGTAVTTGALAVVAVGARRTAGWLAAALPGGEGRLARWGDGAALAGGLLLLAVGLVLFQAAWTTPAHPFR